jgi:glycerophosphoryl diester phosphodiesterase
MMGADAVEPDIVVSRDGVLVVRHENEISHSTDVSDHPEFASRRTSKVVDGTRLTGWFTEDFDWHELSTLRSRERIPKIRPESAAYNDSEPILRLSDVRDMCETAGLVMVAELKHPSYFASMGLALDELLAEELAGWATSDNLILESFEKSALIRARQRGIPGDIVYLIEEFGQPADLAGSSVTFADQITDAGLDALAREVDGISVERTILLETDIAGNAVGTSAIVDRAHERGLGAFVWTLRAENRFLARNHRTGRSARRLGDWQREFAMIWESGVDGVFADQPDLARTARDSRENN